MLNGHVATTVTNIYVHTQRLELFSDGITEAPVHREQWLIKRITTGQNVHFLHTYSTDTDKKTHLIGKENSRQIGDFCARIVSAMAL